jgi:putative adhesin
MFMTTPSRIVMGFALLILQSAGCCYAVGTAEVHATLSVTLAEPVILTVDVPGGDLEIDYSRDGQIAISAVAQGVGDLELDENYFSKVLRVEQNGNNITVRLVANAVFPTKKIKARYRIDVPYRTEVAVSDDYGDQTVRGVMGPVAIRGGHGDISVSHVSKAVRVLVERGNIDLQMIGEHVSATCGGGNIKGERLAKGVSAETGEGDITLMVVGASEATVKHGTGRIDIGGAREGVVSSTDGGDLYVKAVPRSDWKLNSRSGTIRVELPERAGFDLDASTDSGRLQFDRDDLTTLAGDVRQALQKVNGGGKKIEARTESGTIAVR